MKKQRKIVTVVGKTGYGKSYLIKSIISRLHRVVIFDLMSEYAEEKEFDFSDFQYFRRLNDFLSYLQTVNRLDAIQVRITFDNEEHYEAALQACLLVGDVVCVIEEVHNFSSAYYLSPTLEKIVRFGRHKAISLICITQRFSDIGVLLRNNIDLLVCFNLTAPNDLKYLAELPYVGETAQEVGKLKKHQFYAFLNV